MPFREDIEMCIARAINELSDGNRSVRSAVLSFVSDTSKFESTRHFSNNLDFFKLITETECMTNANELRCYFEQLAGIANVETSA